VRSGFRCDAEAVRLLIVDDNASFLAASRAILNGAELNVVGEAASAAEAVERVEELRPDLVLLDIDLGEDSGIELARQLASNGGFAAPKMILISAHPAEDYADIVEDSPALGFIPKADLSLDAVTELLRNRDGA
jgi:DNA-binding NarL/FixJ family response regulator